MGRGVAGVLVGLVAIKGADLGALLLAVVDGCVYD